MLYLVDTAKWFTCPPPRGPLPWFYWSRATLIQKKNQTIPQSLCIVVITHYTDFRLSMKFAGHIKQTERFGAEWFGKAKSGRFADGIILLLSMTTYRESHPAACFVLPLSVKNGAKEMFLGCRLAVLSLSVGHLCFNASWKKKQNKGLQTRLHNTWHLFCLPKAINVLQYRLNLCGPSGFSCWLMVTYSLCFREIRGLISFD